MSNFNIETNYIMDKLSSTSLKTIAAHLGKSVEALEMTLYRKIGSTNTKLHTGMLTAGELARILKVDRNTVIGWIQRHGLKATKRITHSTKRFTFIDVNDFWDWCSHNLEKVDVSKIESYELLPQPSWFNQERKKMKEVSNYKKWTTQEEKLMLKLVQAGKTFTEIAETLDRTTSSVEKKYKRVCALSRKFNNGSSTL